MSGARSWGGLNAKDRERGGNELAKVRRYRRGERPDWAGDDSDSDGDEHREDSAMLVQNTKAAGALTINVTGVESGGGRPRERRVVAPAVVKKKTEAKSATVERPQRPQRPRREVVVPVRKAQTKKDPSSSPSSSSSSASPSSSGSDYTSESDSDSDSESEDAPIAKPVFVRKVERATLAEREAIEREEIERAELDKVRKARQAQESKQIAKEVIAAELAMEEAAQKTHGADEVVTDDDEDPEGDHALWKDRELLRLRRELERALRVREEQREREAWSSMSDADKERYIREKTKAARSEGREKAERRAAEGDKGKGNNDSGRGPFFRDG